MPSLLQMFQGMFQLPQGDPSQQNNNSYGLLSPLPSDPPPVPFNTPSLLNPSGGLAQANNMPGVAGQGIPTPTPSIAHTASGLLSPVPAPDAVYPEMANHSPQNPFSGLNQPIPNQYVPLLDQLGKTNNVNPVALAATMIQENPKFDPGLILKTTNSQGVTSRDRGLWGLNDRAFPGVSDQQATDPNYSSDFIAKQFASNLNYFGGDYNKAIAAHNVGQRGATYQGNTPSGLSPDAQKYIDNVARNLTPETRRSLGLKTTYD